MAIWALLSSTVVTSTAGAGHAEAPGRDLQARTVLANAAAHAVHTAIVERVDDNATLWLKGGERVHLLGIRLAPDADLRAQAARLCADLVAGRAVQLQTGPLKHDRHGRIAAQVHRIDDGTWLQGVLLSEGLAMVETRPAGALAVEAMLAREAHARTAGKGLWTRASSPLTTAEHALDRLGRFAIVEGRVVATAESRGRVYLNFGQDWRTDFTISIAPQDWRRRFRDQGLTHEHYRNRRVRVRGWIQRLNGAMIEVSHPQQIEVLE